MNLKISHNLDANPIFLYQEMLRTLFKGNCFNIDLNSLLFLKLQIGFTILKTSCINDGAIPFLTFNISVGHTFIFPIWINQYSKC